MKRLLLSGLVSAAIVGASAFTAPLTLTKQNAADAVTPTALKNHGASTVTKRIAPGVALSVQNGMKKLHTLKAPFSIKKPSRVVAKAPLPDGMVFFESFEDWPEDDLYWIPDGWELFHRGECSEDESWTPCGVMPMFPQPADGNSMFGINYSMDYQDEWLVTPQIKIENDFQLTFWCYLEPFFIFSLENLDFDAWEYIGDKIVAATLQIWAQPAGEEWTMVHDYADDYIDMTADELYDLTPKGLEKKSLSLAQFAGKDIKLAFRLVGSDGNTVLLDAVGVGYPSLDDVSYLEPFETLYYGFEPKWQMPAMTADIAQYGVYAPITWLNYSDNEDATYSWSYTDPLTYETVTDDGEDVQEELTLMYYPDYSSAATLRNNLCYPPVLNATAPNAAPTEFKSPASFMQMGGTCEFVFSDGSTFNGAYLPYGVNTYGTTMITVFDDAIGDPSIPVFGYNNHTDQYWLNYSLNGQTPVGSEYSHLEGIANLFWPSASPVVVNGLTLAAYGKVADDAEFKATILALNADLERDLSTMTTIATATIKGSDLSRQYADSNGYMALDFTFDEPVTLAATEEHPAYFFLIEGFNSDKVEYFAPMQSKEPLPNYLCWGYTLFHIDMEAQ
ncbi:MAG: choice-of-anchor J domain-containing protein, partial [Muribaculaceae bacterium]|nr:choice-of-anchor J domain-containing protein [Muribaculaceae bacterium]